MRVIFRRELLGYTYTALNISFFGRHINISVERPQKDTDLSFHWQIGK